jgi:hypothetical protein
MSGNHDSDRRSMAPSVPTHNENHNYHDPSNTCIHDMDVDGSQLVVISLLFILGNIFPACAASVLVISDSI